MEYNGEILELEDDLELSDDTDATDELQAIEEVESDATEKAPKKKGVLQLPVIVALCILLAALVGYFAVNLFVPTVEGTWCYLMDYEGEDGADQMSFYYTFDEKAGEKTCVMSLGTIYFPGTYDTVVSDDTNALSVSVYTGALNGYYSYEITGNRLLKNRTMTLSAEDGSTITLTETRKPKIKDYIIPDKDFKKVDKLVGEWEYYYEMFDATMKLTINADGTLMYDQFGVQQLYCVYTADDSKINLSYYNTKPVAQEEAYSFEGDDLVFLGTRWTRVGAESTADQAE